MAMDSVERKLMRYESIVQSVKELGRNCELEVFQVSPLAPKKTSSRVDEVSCCSLLLTFRVKNIERRLGKVTLAETNCRR